MSRGPAGAQAAIGPIGTLNGGLKPTGSLSGECHDQSDLDNTNGYSRSKCNNGWCAIAYGLSFEKDQALANSSIGGHRHDWEHVAVWVRDGQAQYVSTSAHGDFVFGSANVGLKDATFVNLLTEAMPAGLAFVPGA